MKHSSSALKVSTNTQRTYAGRIALYLSYCTENAVDWSRPSLAQLMAMMRWVVDEPLPPKGRRPNPEPRFRDKGTANKIMGTAGEFLTWCALQGWVPTSVVSQLVQPKFLHYAPPGFDAGEDGQHRTVQAQRIKYRVAVPGEAAVPLRRTGATTSRRPAITSNRCGELCVSQPLCFLL